MKICKNDAQNDKKIDDVNEFVYLGSLITDDYGDTKVINKWFALLEWQWLHLLIYEKMEVSLLQQRKYCFNH